MRLVIRAGRLIEFGPSWTESEATLAFDAGSGDFWVLSALGRLVVERLLAGGPQPESLLHELAVKMAVNAPSPGEMSAIVTSLLDAGLLQLEQGVTA